VYPGVRNLKGSPRGEGSGSLSVPGSEGLDGLCMPEGDEPDSLCACA
jgi:hypothetical protein